MIRHHSTILLALSLLLCLAAMMLWARSYWLCDRPTRFTLSGDWVPTNGPTDRRFFTARELAEFRKQEAAGRLAWYRVGPAGAESRSVSLKSWRGLCRLSWRKWSHAEGSGCRIDPLELGTIVFHIDDAAAPYAEPWPGKWQCLIGFRAGNVVHRSGMQETLISVPHWLLVLLTAIMPARWAVACYRRRRRTRSGHCIACGYDLRASTERCPECGTPIPSNRVMQLDPAPIV